MLSMSLIPGFSPAPPSHPHCADSSPNLVDPFFQRASCSTCVCWLTIKESCMSRHSHLPVPDARTLARLQFLQNSQNESNCPVWSFVVCTRQMWVVVIAGVHLCTLPWCQCQSPTESQPQHQCRMPPTCRPYLSFVHWHCSLPPCCTLKSQR